jgi:predicted alpha/beta-hydrolase family hydrolase
VAERFTIDTPRGETVSALEYRAEGDPLGATLILGHGAGAPHVSKWMVQTARGLAARGVDVVTFNFPYMELRKHVPDRAEVLEAAFRAAIQAVRQRPAFGSNRLFLGGKSMGGRMASHVASTWDDQRDGGPLAGLVFLGYPLHPPGKPQQLRSAHLPQIRVPMLFIQGSRDAFGTPGELRPILAELPASATLTVIEGGDHSFAVPKSSATPQSQIDEDMLQAVAGFIAQPHGTRAASKRA